MTKIQEWAKKNASIAMALGFATHAHQGQLDKAGEEYIKHPVAVALSFGMSTPKLVVVALLHDVLAHTKETEENLKKLFPSEIIDALHALTRKTDEDYMSFIGRCCLNPLARAVKIADLRHNLKAKRLKKLSKKVREHLSAKYTPALNYLLHFVDKDELSKQLSEECKDLPSGILPHDAMNKAAFAHDEIFVSFLRSYVDEAFIKDLDLTHIESLPGEFVSEQMSKRYSDSIRKVRWKGSAAYLLVLMEYQSTKDVWVPVRVLVYAALLWLDLILHHIVTRKTGLPPVFPIVIYSGEKKWNGPLSIHALLSPVAKHLLKYQPNNLALLIEEKTIKDEVLNKNSDFYALYLALKRAKTPMAMQEVIKKYKDVLAQPKHYELLKTIIAMIETLYKRFNQNAGASDIRFSSLEEAVKMIESTAIDWKKNTQEYFLNEFKKAERQEGIKEGIKKGKKKWMKKGEKKGEKKGKLDAALAMLREGFSLELIERITQLPSAEIEKLKK